MHCHIQNVDKSEVLRYLGYPKNSSAPNLEKELDEYISAALEAASVKYVFRSYPIEAIPMIGNDIVRHLQNCEQAFILCVTTGQELERLIHKKMLASPEEAVILDACASVIVEQAADIACSEISNHGFEITKRFSPGYGDYPLSLQKALISMTDAIRKIGLSVTSSNLLTPQKSITAIIGVGKNIPPDNRTENCKTNCEQCSFQANCRFKKR